jgi:hypothetical protein
LTLVKKGARIEQILKSYLTTTEKELLMKTIDRSLAQNENLQEIFLTENFNGTWTPKQLTSFEEEFNGLSVSDEQRRQIILNRFFHATAISWITIDKLSFISGDAVRIDLHHAQFSGLQRAELMSKHLSQFSDMRFGPASKEKKESKHDAHVKAYMYAKVPPPYQRKFKDEPKLLGAIELLEEKDAYQITIKHLVRTSGFCRCIRLNHRETMYALPLEKIVGIQMISNSNGSHNLHIEIAK